MPRPVIQQLHLATFIPGPPIAVLNVLASMFPGVTPSAFQNHGPLQTATLELGGFQITVASQMERIDFVIAPPEPQLPPLSATPKLDLDAASRLLLPPVGAFASRQDTKRLAVIINAAREVGSAQETVAIAREMIPGLNLPEGTSEIDYKINVPRPSNFEQITLNRLHRWFSAARTVIQFTVGPQGPAMAPVHDMGWALVEVIDVNTAMESEFVPANSLGLLEEMTKEASDLYAKGFEAFS